MGKYNHKDNGLTVDLRKVDMKEVEQEALVDEMMADAEEHGIVVSDIVAKIPEGWGEIDTTSDQQAAAVTNLEGIKTTSAPKASAVSAELQAYLDTLPTKSAKIRHMNSLGFRRAQIANHLGIIYQHVRNVLTQEVKRPRNSVEKQMQPVQQMATSQNVVPEEIAINEGSCEPQMRIYG